MSSTGQETGIVEYGQEISTPYLIRDRSETGKTSLDNWTKGINIRTGDNKIEWGHPSQEYEVIDVVIAKVKTETLDGCVGSIHGELALVEFNTPEGPIERYVGLEVLRLQKADYPGARIRLIIKRIGSETNTDIINVSSEIPPVWERVKDRVSKLITDVKLLQASERLST
jgi:hypothetical protein